MSHLHVSTMPGGSELLRMVRPRSSDWDWTRWCAVQGCNKPCASIYGWWEAGAKSMIGWRAACSRKHALAIWRRELDPDFEPIATPDAGSRTT